MSVSDQQVVEALKTLRAFLSQQNPVDPTDPTDPVDPDPGTTDPPPTGDTPFAVGANGFHWVDLDKLSIFDTVRFYIGSHWLWRPNGLFVQPLFQAEVAHMHGLDDLLQGCKARGIEPLFCIHQTPEWFVNTGRGDGGNDYAPCKLGADRADPKSYKDYANFLFQVAARYGSTRWDDAFLEVDTTPRWNGDVPNVAKSGLGLLKYMEPWNEEKWWKKGTPEDPAYIRPEEMAALMSACYDGAEEVEDDMYGIKNADLKMKVVMPGLSDYDMPYILKMDAWFKANRKDKKWPCDVFNIHHYSNIGNVKGKHPQTWVEAGACPPEQDKAFDGIREIVAFARSLGLPVWLTEFGADTKRPSQMAVPATEKAAAEQQQADIIVKSFRAYREAGVERAYVFTAIDDLGAADGGQFETSGVMSSQATGAVPKPAYYAIEKLAKEFGVSTFKMPQAK